jgi:predicted nucleic acid-binding protein
VVLVDTSVWIRFLAGREPYATGLDALLGTDEVAGHDLVFGELLIGDRGGRAKLLGAYAHMHHCDTVPHDELVEFVRQRRLFGRGVGWIDVQLLASAVVGRLELWTADQEFAAVARELRVAFKDGRS